LTPPGEDIGTYLQSNSGAELDWLRTFWDLHTNGASPPTFTYIADTFMDGTAAWTKLNVYTMFDARADALGGTLNSTWDLHAKCDDDGDCDQDSNRVCYPVKANTSCP
jgi:hypothetical protein